MVENKVVSEGGQGEIPKQKGPFFGVIWFCITIILFTVVHAASDFNTLRLIIGFRQCIALAGYLIMQIGLWHAENKWDEEGSVAWLDAAGQDPKVAPEVLEAKSLAGDFGEPGKVEIPDDKLKAAFPVPWGFLIGWWVWGISYIFPLDGTSDIDPTVTGIIAMIICFFISIVASIPMSDAVMKRKAKKKMILSLMFLIGWISLGITSSLDVIDQLNDDKHGTFEHDTKGVWVMCMLGPITVIISQKILFGSRKMGTLWETSGSPNFHPVSIRSNLVLVNAPSCTRHVPSACTLLTLSCKPSG
eukprot:7641409-Pyramimonas_sp.AAC.1